MKGWISCLCRPIPSVAAWLQLGRVGGSSCVVVVVVGWELDLSSSGPYILT